MKLGKVALLLVIIGWFCPIACQQNGPSLLMHTEGNYRIAAILLLVSVILAAIVLIRINNEDESGKLKAALSAACGGISLLIFREKVGHRGSIFDSLESGAYIMMAGWISSLFCLFVLDEILDSPSRGSVVREEPEEEETVTPLSFTNQSADYSPENGTWKCDKCGHAINPPAILRCEKCGEPRYKMSTLSQDKKQIVQDFIAKVLAMTNFEDAIKLQDSYFGTTSLAFVTVILPDAKTFSDFDDYKTKLSELIQ